MTQITRTFDNAAQAKAAVDELKQRRFGAVELVEVAGRRGSGRAAAVRVDAPFGTAVAATAILERHGGKAESSATQTEPQPPATQPSPVQATAEPAAVATATSQPAPPKPQPAVARETARPGPRTVSEWLGIPELIDSNTFFSGFPLLIRPSRKPRAADTPRAGKPD